MRACPRIARRRTPIACQTAALIEYARNNGLQRAAGMGIQDEGYSGAILVRLQ
jgi:hypothetical protein